MKESFPVEFQRAFSSGIESKIVINHCMDANFYMACVLECLPLNYIM